VQPPRTRYAQTTDGAYVAYQVTGEGDHDILCMFGHGISVEDQMDGPPRHFIERLSQFARVIRFDRRGVGLSDPLPSIDETSWESWLDDIDAVLDAVGAPTVTIVGTDTTVGVISMLLAASRPERVRRLVLFNPQAAWNESDDYPFGFTQEERHALLQRVREEWLDDGPVPFFGPNMQADGAFARWWRRARRRSMSPTVAQAVYRNGLEADLRAVLSSVRVSTLVLYRAAHTIRPDRFRAGVEYLVEHLPDTRLVELPGDEFVVYAGPYETVVHEVEEFVTGTRSEVFTDRVLATVMFTDLVASTERVSAVGDRAWREQLDAHDGLIRSNLERSRGREIKMTGDGVVATFDGPARAVACAQAIVDDAAAMGLDVRVGLHTGEIELRGDDIGGLAVHIGARVSQLAGPREILVSRTVVDLVAGSRLAFEDRGEHALKGVDGTWRVFGVSRGASPRR
jgi:class 3 adenylate cyclase